MKIKHRNLLLWLALIILIVRYVASHYGVDAPSPEPSGPGIESSEKSTGQQLDVQTAFRKRLADVQVEGQGTVVKLLPDDNSGSRHQRFLVKISKQLTVLISHNIDLAPRVENLQESEQIAFFGEYVWNDKGGLVHWTHHDPKKKHPDGWLRHREKIYR